MFKNIFYEINSSIHFQIIFPTFANYSTIPFIMEIVYFWVNNYRNLRNVGVNFGSEYHFELMVDKNTQTCIVDTTPNPKHLKCFFNPFVNITAIVGENASGKSSLLEALRMALDGNPRDYFEYVIIYNDGKNSYYYKYFLGYIKEESEPTGFIFDKQRELSYDFNFKTHGLTFEQRDHNHRHETIFFSQLIDLNIYPLNNDTPLGIDISSNWLSYMACNTQKENNLPYEPLEFLRMKKLNAN